MTIKTRNDTTGLDQLESTTQPARDAVHFRRILAARKAIADAEQELRDAVKAARDAGDSWTVIGAALVQAVGNEYLTLLKFSHVEEARRYAETLGPDGHQIDPLVLHFNGKPLSAPTRDEIIAGVSGINVSSPD